MRIHEFQAKGLLSRFGVRVPKGEVARSAEEVPRIVKTLGSDVVLKAQIHAGGRGKAGGIRTARGPQEAEDVARRMIGMSLVTPQTGLGGKIVKKLLVEEALDIRREIYLSMAIDRGLETIVFMASTEGGTEVETIAAEKPDLIFKEYADPAFGLLAFQAQRLVFKLGLRGEIHEKTIEFILSVCKAFFASDAALIEINPLGVTAQGEILALDAKMELDDNALFRHPDLKALRDPAEESPLEVEASKSGLNYIKLDGNIGCMVNGAGLAMATMDMIKDSGGSPANFLDVGGSVSESAVANAFKILVLDQNVKAALINIFGGIVRCDLIAAGIVKAAREIGHIIPTVIRLEGTNVDLGKKILEESGLGFALAPDMKSAAEKAVSLAKGNG